MVQSMLYAVVMLVAVAGISLAVAPVDAASDPCYGAQAGGFTGYCGTIGVQPCGAVYVANVHMATICPN